MTSTDPVSDEAKLAVYAQQLHDGLEQHTRQWVGDVAVRHLGAERGIAAAAELSDDVEAVIVEIGELLRTDIDAQRANPLALLRSLVAPITDVLRRHGAVEVSRDPDAQRLFPDDVFDVTPGAFSDIHPDLHMPGLAWGAAKAHVHLQRRRAEGLR